MATDWKKERKLTRLPVPGVANDPVVFIAQLYEMAKAGQIKSIAASIEWGDGSLDDAHMEMSNAMLLAHAHVLMDKAHACIMGRD
jgi:hypothetical protein